MHVVAIPVDTERYGIPLEATREVVSAPVLTPVPTAPAEILGLFNVRGEIVPLFDTAQLLGLGSGGVPAFAVLVETSLGFAGLAAAGMPAAIELEDEVVSAPEVPGGVSTHLAPGGLVVLLDVEALLAHRGAH